MRMLMWVGTLLCPRSCAPGYSDNRRMPYANRQGSARLTRSYNGQSGPHVYMERSKRTTSQLTAGPHRQMRRLSLTAMPSRRKHRQSLGSACGKSTSSLRSTFGNFSMLSTMSASVSSDSLTSLSTASSSYGGLMEDYDDVDEQLEDEECCEQGWMYWKKDADCWLKMYARLRNELLWLSKGADDVVAVVQIAVAGVRATDIGGIIARGPAGESMELFAYERECTRDWIDALYVAAQLTQSFERSVAAEQAETPYHEAKEVEQVYTGTLVIYNKEKKKAPWKQLLSTKRLRDACRRRLEKFVDRLDTSKR